MVDVLRDVGNVDILVNNAGIVSARRLQDCPDVIIQRVMDLNIMASIWVKSLAFKCCVNNDNNSSLCLYK